MIPKDIFLGVLYSSSKKSITVFRSEDTNFGYKIRFGLSIRGTEHFLKLIQERLNYEGIKSNLNLSDSKSRPRPILKITEVYNLIKLIELIESNSFLNPKINSIFENNSWSKYKEALFLMLDKKHYTDKGFNRILKIKEEVKV